MAAGSFPFLSFGSFLKQNKGSLAPSQMLIIKSEGLSNYFYSDSKDNQETVNLVKIQSERKKYRKNQAQCQPEEDG